jgi:hypothetical protein
VGFIHGIKDLTRHRQIPRATAIDGSIREGAGHQPRGRLGRRGVDGRGDLRDYCNLYQYSCLSVIWSRGRMRLVFCLGEAGVRDASIGEDACGRFQVGDTGGRISLIVDTKTS